MPDRRSSPLLALPLLSAALLAGCLGAPADAPPPGPGPGAPAQGFAFFPPVEVDTPARGASEPSIAVDAEGRIFVSGPAGVSRSSYAWRSVDNGTTWEAIDPNPRTPTGQGAGGGDTTTNIGPNGEVYISDLWVGSNTVSVSTDHGDTWFTTPVSSTVPFYDRQWLTVDGEGRAYLIARTFLPGATTWAQRSDDTGRTWRTVGLVWQDAPTGDVLGGGFQQADPNQNGPLIWNEARDALHVVWACHNQKRAVCLATSTDQAATWSSVDVVRRDTSIFHIFPAVAADAAGNLYVAWADATDGSLDIWLSRSSDGAAWSEPRKVNAAPGTHLFPWVVAGDAGRVAVVWYGTDAVGDNNDPAAMEGAAWHVHASVALDGMADAPAWQEARVTPQPIHNGTVSTHGFDPTSSPAPDRTLGDFFSAAIDPWGALHIAFTKGSREGSDPETTMYARQSAGPLLYAQPRAAPAGP